MIDYQALIERWSEGEMSPWAEVLPQQIDSGLSHKRYGDLARWQKCVQALPDIQGDIPALNDSQVGITSATALDESTMAQLHDALMGLHPWRKGPYNLFGVHIDTEWRSDWKWDRLATKIAPLRGRRVLDVGCGSGYHCWRMLGDGAVEVIGIDPTPLFVMQFSALQKYMQQDNIWVLPVGIQDIPKKLQVFDTVFSMGILYHRRSPMDHLQDLKDALRPGGQLVLETLVIEGELGDTLVPQGRYAKMGNVWFLPSCDTLIAWLAKMGFVDIALIDVTVTSTEEQRSTDWMRFHSLSDFLDPNDRRKSFEGHPAPRRAIITAQTPS
ncbi:MAG: tRNA (mo5U34)-methyltransferase [Halioglobus sp.]